MLLIKELIAQVEPLHLRETLQRWVAENIQEFGVQYVLSNEAIRYAGTAKADLSECYTKHCANELGQLILKHCALEETQVTYHGECTIYRVWAIKTKE